MEIINLINEYLWSYLLIALLIFSALYFTIRTKGVQFTMLGEMLRLLFNSGKGSNDNRDANVSKNKTVSSFQALMVSLASRVGTGNLAGVATAIAIGGPGAVFWMWIIAILGSANAFIESTLAQLYKVKGAKSYMGGPAYYIKYGIGQNWWAILFAILITVTFGLAYNSVQSNTIALATFNQFGWSRMIVGIVLTVLSLAIVCGSIQRISRFSEIVVPIMAVAYIILAITIIAINITSLPDVLSLIVTDAFDFSSAIGGGMGMTMIMGIKRGLFSNEAGEGSAPNVAATASVSHPVKQGLIQTLAVYTDTIIICTCTAFIILCSGVFDNGHNGIELTQDALNHEIGAIGSSFVTIAIFFFAFTSIVGNYYYGETNIQFMTKKRWVIYVYRIAVGAMVMIGAVSQLDFAWALADITMGLMTLCNIAAILVLGKYAIRLLDDYRNQKLKGYDPTYRSSTIPEIADKTRCWE
ncbi:MAG: alanine/glycine:cation symporter family protein [Muribaculaceae bacterium]|nr:alanine/glycine:cation symporter family protein [Muribaculaceae bacterium]